MQSPSFLPKIQALSGVSGDTIELRSHEWNTFVYNQRTGQASNIKLKIHHMRPLNSVNNLNQASASDDNKNKVQTLSSYTISRPINYLNIIPVVPAPVVPIAPAVTVAPVTLVPPALPVATTSSNNNTKTVESITKNTVTVKKCNVMEKVNDPQPSTSSATAATSSIVSFKDIIEEEPIEYENPDNLETHNTESPENAGVFNQSSKTEYFVERNGLHKVLNLTECPTGIFPIPNQKDLEKKENKTIQFVTSKRVPHGRIVKLKLDKISTPLVEALNKTPVKPNKVAGMNEGKTRKRKQPYSSKNLPENSNKNKKS